MKNRKTIIVAFLLVAALCLGIGYAALTDQLNITGSADIDPAEAGEVYDADVFFTSYELLTDGLTEGDAEGEDVDCVIKLVESGDDALNKPDSATINIYDGLGVVGDKVEVKFTIKNESAEATSIALKTSISEGEKSSTSTNGYFMVYVAGAQTYSVESGGSVDITVCVELLKTVDEAIEASEFGLYLTATSAG